MRQFSNYNSSSLRGRWQVVAQALGLALTIGLFVAVGVQLLGPQVLVKLAGEKSKEVGGVRCFITTTACVLFICLRKLRVV